MRPIDELLARSSLGTPNVRAARKRAPRALVEQVLARANQLSARQISAPAPHSENHQNHSLVPRSGDPPMFAAPNLAPGQFRIAPIRVIGEGGLGIVDEVEVVASNMSHPSGTRLARKRLSQKWANDPGARGRFEREIDMLQTMRHPNIVSLAGVSLPGGERWYVMPLFQRGSLRTWLQAGGRFATVQQVAGFIATVAGALSYAHSMNFIHRDIKPENILLSDSGGPVVADWGLGQFVHLHSKVLDLTRGGPMGTHYYCSLEQWASGRCEQTGDVYSLGVVLAELAAGRALPISPIGAGIQDAVVGGSSAVVQNFNATIRRMTAMLPSARFQSIDEVARLLRRINLSP